MTNQRILSQAKEIIKDCIRSAAVGEGIRIPVEDEANLTVFEQANRSADIQRMAAQKHIVSIEFYIPDLVGQAKEQMLSVINGCASDVQQIIFPCLPVDHSVMMSALQLPEVQQALLSRGITASLRTVNQEGKPSPKIVIATYDDLINGNLDRFMREHNYE